MGWKEYNALSREVIRGAIEVDKGLGPELLERVYENVFSHEMQRQRLEETVIANETIPKAFGRVKCGNLQPLWGTSLPEKRRSRDDRDFDWRQL